MPVKTYDEYEFGFSWVMDEPLERASHALVADGKVWLIDPVDEAEAVDRATALGEPAAVLHCSIATTATAPSWPSAWVCST